MIGGQVHIRAVDLESSGALNPLLDRPRGPWFTKKWMTTDY